MEARFVCKGGNYSVGVRPAVVEDYATGRQKVVVAHLEAQFSPRDVQDADLRTIEEAHRTKTGVPKLKAGLPFDRETEEHVSIRSRLGVWDSRDARKTLASDDVDAIIVALRSSDRFGLDYVEVESAAAKAPWPAYDKMDGRHPDRIVERALENGCDLNDVIVYERENKARRLVLEALNEALDPDAQAPAEVVITA